MSHKAILGLLFRAWVRFFGMAKDEMTTVGGRGALNTATGWSAGSPGRRAEGGWGGRPGCFGDLLGGAGAEFAEGPCLSDTKRERRVDLQAQSEEPPMTPLPAGK